MWGGFALAPVVQRANNSIHQINHYPMPSSLLLDSDLSGELALSTL